MKAVNAARLARPITFIILLVLLTAAIGGCGDGGGSTGLSAEATSPGSILLKWNSDAGARSYTVQVKLDGEYVTIAELDSGTTSYEDLKVPAESTMTYRVQPVTESGANGGSEASATTPPASPHPLTVQARFESGTAASGTIGPSGGTLSATGANGVTYRLELPAGAVENDTAFTLTPISAIDGWPLDGKMLGAVRIEPEGLQLDAPGWLTYTITGAQAAGGLAPTGFAFEGSGTEFHLQPVYPADAGATVSNVPTSVRGGSANRFIRAGATFVKAGVLPQSFVNHTGSQGVGTVSSQRAAEIARNNAPSKASDRAKQQQAAQPDEEQLAPLPPINKNGLIKEAAAVRELIKKADDCQKLQAAINQAAAWEGQRGGSKAGSDSSVKSAGDKMIQDLVDKAADLFNKAREKCQKKEAGASATAGCLETIRGKISKSKASVYSKMRQKMESQFGEDYLGNLYGDFKYCVAYSASGGTEVSFSGKINVLAEPFSLTGTKPTGTATFSFTPGADGLSGSWKYSIPPYEQGSGSYTAAVTDKGGTLQLNGGMQLNVEGVSFSKAVSETITLTAVEKEGNVS